MEDKRAHERLDGLEADVKRIEISMDENTKLTKSIEENTRTIVEIMQGARGVMLLITTMAKVGGVIAALYVLWHGFVTYLRGH